MQTLKAFRITAFLEGLSYILLLFVAVPVKYMLGNESLVKILGMPHGLLFVLYIIFAFWLKPDSKWTTKEFLLILVASLIPFGTFYIDRKYLRPAS